MASIQKRHITLPKWLDDLLFNKLSASYCRTNKDIVVLDWGHKDILRYLGTYFIIAKTKCAFFQNEMCIFCIFFRGFPARS